MLIIIARLVLLTAVCVAGGLYLQDWRALYAMIPVVGITVFASMTEIEGNESPDPDHPHAKIPRN